MLTGEMAKYQIKDRISAAERDRVAGSVSGPRQRGRKPVVRRIGSGLMAAVVATRRKATPTSAPIEIRLG